MSVDDKLSAKPQIDTTDYKTGIAEMNRLARVLETGFRASAAALGDWTQSATGLEKRIETLNAQIDIQRQKVALTRAEYERIRKEKGENSRAAQEMEIRLNKETEALNKMENELHTTEGSLVELKNKSDNASESMKQTTKFSDLLKGSFAGLKGMTQGLIVELKTVATVLKGELAVALGVLKVGAGSVLALGSAALVTGGLLVGMTFKAAAAADQMGELADKTGISVQRLQEMDFIGKIIGTDLDTMTGANARLIRSMSTAVDQSDKYNISLGKQRESIQKAQEAYNKAIKEHGRGSEEAQKALAKLNDEEQQFSDLTSGNVAEAFRTLGVRVRDANGNLRDSQVVFKEAIDALGRIQNPTERDALAMAIFGKSAQELNPLIKLGSKGFQELADKANLVGAVVDEKTNTALGDLNDQLDILKSGAGGLTKTILGAFAPFFSGVLDSGINNLVTLVRLVKSSNGDFGTLAGNLGGFFTGLIQGIAGAAPGLIQGGLQLVKSLLKSVLDAAPDLIQAASQIITLLTQAIIQNLPALSKAGLQILPKLINAALQALPQLFNVGIAILSAIVDALIAALPQLINELPGVAAAMISNLLAAIERAFPQLLPLAVRLIQTLITFLRNNLTELIQLGVPLISQLIQAIIPLLPLLIDAALKIIIALANGISSQLPVLVPAIVDVIIQIVQVLTDNLPLLIQAALILILALAQGLIKALPTLIAAIPKLVTGIINALIASMPMFFTAAGKLIGMLATGIIASIPVAILAIAQLITGLGNSLARYMVIAPQLGRNFIIGLANGIRSAAGYLFSIVGNVISGMITYIHNLLDMHSPSGVGEDIGANFFGSIGGGGKKASSGVQDTFKGLIHNLTSTVGNGLQAAANGLNGPQFALAGAGASGHTTNNSSTQNVAMHNTFIINKELDIDVVAQKIKQRLIGK